MALNFYHIASLDTIQATSLNRNFITASTANASALKAVALEDSNFQEWVLTNVISERAAPPQQEIQKLFDLSSYPQPPFIAIMPVASSSLPGQRFTTCNLYQFETEAEFRQFGWKIPAIDGNPIGIPGTTWNTIQEGATAISSNGGLLYYYDSQEPNNKILS